MKLLVIDVGNTSTAVGRWSNGRVCKVVHIDDGFAAAAAAAESLLALESPAGDIAGVAYVSVVPRVDGRWRRWAKTLKLPFHQVSHRDFRPFSTSTFDLDLDYPKPETIGADRLCDAAAAVSRYGAPVLVMDFGTALTAAIVTHDRVWRGGVIAPGFPLMRDYLFERTAKLPRMEMGAGRAPRIGRSTEEAMRFGALVGYRGMVREIVTTLKANFKEDFRLVATGGFARWVLKDLDMPFIIDSSLTLYGAGLLGIEKFKMKVERSGGEVL